MARIEVPGGPGGDAAMVWSLRPEMAGMVERMITTAYSRSILDPTEREAARMRIAERFAVDHRAIDDELFARLRGPFTDAEILDLTLCCAVFVGLGRTLEVLQITEAVDRDL